MLARTGNGILPESMRYAGQNKSVNQTALQVIAWLWVSTFPNWLANWCELNRISGGSANVFGPGFPWCFRWNSWGSMGCDFPWAKAPSHRQRQEFNHQNLGPATGSLRGSKCGFSWFRWLLPHTMPHLTVATTAMPRQWRAQWGLINNTNPKHIMRVKLDHDRAEIT